jgi:predicted RNA-binding protein YlxR (DUF448 family)
LRIALAGACEERPRRAVIDRDGTLGGRGAYLCRGAGPDAPDRACAARAARAGAIARALRCAVTLDAKIVESLTR